MATRVPPCLTDPVPSLPALAALYLYSSRAGWAVLWVYITPLTTLSSHKWPFGDCHSCHFFNQSLVLCVSVFVHMCLYAHVCVWKKAWVRGKRKENSLVWSQIISYSHLTLKEEGCPVEAYPVTPSCIQCQPSLALTAGQNLGGAGTFPLGCWTSSFVVHASCSPCYRWPLPAPYAFWSHAGSPSFCAYFLENCL